VGSKTVEDLQHPPLWICGDNGSSLAAAAVFDVAVRLTVTVSVSSVPRFLGRPAVFSLKNSVMSLFLPSVAYSSVLIGFLGGAIVIDVNRKEEKKESLSIDRLKNEGRRESVSLSCEGEKEFHRRQGGRE
jgi:hypothetical protein